MRIIKKEERELIKSIIKERFEIPKYVKDLSDGDMGSISFDLKNENKRFDCIFKAEYINKDNVLTDIELTINEKGELYEFDFFKTNFNKLVSYPEFKQLRIKKC